MIELDSQLSEIKEVDYNLSISKNSSNNIDQKANIKEMCKINDNLININEIKSFNYEKVAMNKMQYINLNIIMDSILRLKNILKNDNPLLKYIEHATPFNISSIKLDSKDFKKNNKDNIGLILNKKDNIIDKNISKKLGKEMINFNSKNTKKNFYYTRMCNIETKKINSSITDKIILIQKNIRGFLSKKIVYSSLNKEIAKNIITSVLTIQRAFRKFLLKKNSLNNYIINIIQNERNNKGNKIIQLFKVYHTRNLFLKNLLIKKIVVTRHLSAQLIQSTFKSYILRRKVLDLLKKEKKCFVLIYPFEAESVEIKIFLNGINNKFKTLEYFRCPVRKYFVTYLDKKEIKPGEYLCQMQVNDDTVLDKRYKYVNKNGNLYNLIPIGSYKKKKPKHLKKGTNDILKGKDKKINEELDNFYFYYYSNEEEKDNSSDISHSQKSDFSKKESNNNNRINYLNEIDDDPDQVIDISKSRYNYKYNNTYLKSNYNYVKEYQNKKKEIELLENRIKNLYDKLYSQKEEIDNQSIHNSENLNYKNILDELVESTKSVTSNISMKNIDFYSKKTHKAKFKKKDDSKAKNSKKAKIKKYNIKF